MRKNDMKLHKMTYPAPENPPGGIPNIFTLRCHQNLSNTVYKIKIDSVEENIKFGNEELREVFCIPGVMKRYKNTFPEFFFFEIFR